MAWRLKRCGLTIREYSYTVTCMKTTFDLPDELVSRAKMVALSRKTTLRSLVLKGLQRELESPSPEPQNPLRALRDIGKEFWAETQADEYVRNLREDWT